MLFYLFLFFSVLFSSLFLFFLYFSVLCSVFLYFSHFSFSLSFPFLLFISPLLSLLYPSQFLSLLFFNSSLITSLLCQTRRFSHNFQRNIIFQTYISLSPSASVPNLNLLNEFFALFYLHSNNNYFSIFSSRLSTFQFIFLNSLGPNHSNTIYFLFLL